jgi:hypothetical protein
MNFFFSLLPYIHFFSLSLSLTLYLFSHIQQQRQQQRLATTAATKAQHKHGGENKKRTRDFFLHSNGAFLRKKKLSMDNFTPSPFCLIAKEKENLHT